MTEPETHRFRDDGRFPNSRLPLAIYRPFLLPDAAAMEATFAAHGWSNAWWDGIFPCDHVHSIAHEVLGVLAGKIHVAFGAPTGREVAVRAGDVVVIPAGVVHRKAGGTSDLLVVGAYPGGGDYDIRRGSPGEHAAALGAIAAVPLPAEDPVFGEAGALRHLWGPP
ncbi:cupin domain-containing protein [Roseomonas sp. CCTCC AB2023176]|uniref:cupin domain-containing protein n=1 Tax=Roseomonas sp. CCTCC AB2023176 TaxID=3342640 RepID=UPI0035D9B124